MGNLPWPWTSSTRWTPHSRGWLGVFLHVSVDDVLAVRRKISRPGWVDFEKLVHLAKAEHNVPGGEIRERERRLCEFRLSQFIRPQIHPLLVVSRHLPRMGQERLQMSPPFVRTPSSARS